MLSKTDITEASVSAEDSVSSFVLGEIVRRYMPQQEAIASLLKSDIKAEAMGPLRNARAGCTV